MQNKKTTILSIILVVVVAILLVLVIKKPVTEVVSKQLIPENYVQYEDSENGFSFWYPKNTWNELKIDRAYKRDGTGGQFTFETHLKSEKPLFLVYGGATKDFNIYNPKEGGRETSLSDYSQSKSAFLAIALDDGQDATVSEFKTNEGVVGVKVEGKIPASDCEMGCFFSDANVVYFFELKKYSGGVFFGFPTSKDLNEVDAVMKTLVFNK